MATLTGTSSSTGGLAKVSEGVMVPTPGSLAPTHPVPTEALVATSTPITPAPGYTTQEAAR
jgi:hypothetical protein